MKELTPKDCFNEPAALKEYVQEYSSADLNYQTLQKLKPNKKVLSLGGGADEK